MATFWPVSPNPTSVSATNAPRRSPMQVGGKSMTRYTAITLATLVAATLLPGIADAQQVSQERIVTGLGKLTAAAPVVDLELLRQEALRSGGAPMSGLPNWSKIEKLPQMVVEIDFQNNSTA